MDLKKGDYVETLVKTYLVPKKSIGLVTEISDGGIVFNSNVVHVRFNLEDGFKCSAVFMIKDVRKLTEGERILHMI